MPTRNDSRVFHASLVSLFALAVCAITAAQITSTRPPNPNVTPPARQRPQAPARSQEQIPGAQAPKPVPAPPNGTIEGFVYWDANVISHVPSGSCSGLAITLSAGSPQGPFTSYSPIATLSNNFKYIGKVTKFTGGQATVYDVCAYGFGRVPVGPNLQVKLTVAQPGAFSPIAVPQFSMLSPIKIVNGQCNMLPNIMNPTAADLVGSWGTCQNMAYNVNFVMAHAAHLLSNGGSGGGSSGSATGSQKVMLSGSDPVGMPAAAQPAPATSGQLLPAKPGAGGTVQLNPQPYPPKGRTSGPAGGAQVVQFKAGGNVGTSRGDWKSNRLIASAMSHVAVLAPANPMPGSHAANSALIGLLRKQKMAAQALLVSSDGPSHGGMLSGGSKAMVSSQFAAKGSAPQIGAGQIMESKGSGRSGSSNGGSVLQQPSRSRASVVPTQACAVGIAAVDGQKSGVWFSPVSGPDGMFVIQGCGFGTSPGQVYLSGVHYAPAPTSSATLGVVGPSLARDQIAFQFSAGNWSDRQIVAQIDPNASGFYDTGNVTLVVKTANEQIYQATGFNFSAARVDQVLTGILKAPSCRSSQNGCIPAGINLALVSAGNGQVQADAESPSVSLVKSGETIAVARQSSAGQFPIPAAPGLSFSGATDIYKFQFAPGFQLDPHTGVQLRHTSLDSNYCQSVNGVPSTKGNWNVTYTSTSSFQVSWAEEGCWPKSSLASGSNQQWLDYGSVSAYALDITVLGPRGVSPWASGNTNGLTIQKHLQLLPR